MDTYTATVIVYGQDVPDLVRAARQHGKRLMGANPQGYTATVELGPITLPDNPAGGADSTETLRYSAVATITMTPPAPATPPPPDDTTTPTT